MKCEEECNMYCNITAVNCDQKSGSCASCKEGSGHWGPACEFKSTDHCYMASKINGTCLQCEATYFLNSTKKCEKCAENCLNYECSDTTGECKECNSVYNWGVKCENVCATGCETEGLEVNYVCERSSGKCVKCKPTFYGDFCSSNCSEWCKGEEKRTCGQETGRCDECKEGSYMNATYDNCRKCEGNCKYCNAVLSVVYWTGHAVVAATDFIRQIVQKSVLVVRRTANRTVGCARLIHARESIMTQGNAINHAVINALIQTELIDAIYLLGCALLVKAATNGVLIALRNATIFVKMILGLIVVMPKKQKI